MSIEIDIGFLMAADWWSRVDVSNPRGCWPWKQSTGSHGYGQTWDGRSVLLAHRVAWTLHNGKQIPDGLTVDHECRNRLCCNPFHLRLMDNLSNAEANGMALRTHCVHGHEYTDANTYVNRRGHRSCRTCAANRRRVA